jgi:hypothetical protein
MSTGQSAPVQDGLSSPLPDRPPLTDSSRAHGRPGDVRSGGGRWRTGRQPAVGLAGLLLVVPIAVLLAVAAGGPERSVVVLAPLVTFALPPVVMIAFYWEDWPGTLLRPQWSGWFDTLLIAVAAVVLTIVGQAVVGSVDLRGVFDPNPGPGHSAVFPAVMPLAGAAFVVMLQITFVNEGWPFRRLGRLGGGLAAFVAALGIGLLIYALLVDFHPRPGSGLAARSGPIPGAELGAVLVAIGAWQVITFVVWRGWPFAGIHRRAVRLPAANATVLAAGVLTYVVAHGLGGLEPVVVNATTGAVVAAGLVVGIQFEGALDRDQSPAAQRSEGLLVVLVIAAVLYTALTLIANSLTWTDTLDPQEWVGHVALNALAVSVILHVAIGRRWPFQAEEGSATPEATSGTAARSGGRETGPGAGPGSNADAAGDAANPS